MCIASARGVHAMRLRQIACCWEVSPAPYRGCFLRRHPLKQFACACRTFNQQCLICRHRRCRRISNPGQATLQAPTYDNSTPVLVITLLCRAPRSDAAEDSQTTALAKALIAGGSGNGDRSQAPALGGGGGGGNGAAEAVATPRTPTRDGEDGSLISIVTAQRDRFRQRC